MAIPNNDLRPVGNAVDALLDVAVALVFFAVRAAKLQTSDGLDCVVAAYDVCKIEVMGLPAVLW
jgi:hypothetical protein